MYVHFRRFYKNVTTFSKILVFTTQILSKKKLPEVN